jgi:hypothetical protein
MCAEGCGWSLNALWNFPEPHICLCWHLYRMCVARGHMWVGVTLYNGPTVHVFCLVTHVGNGPTVRVYCLVTHVGKC